MKTTSRTKRIALLFDSSIGYCRDVLEGVQTFARSRPNWVFFDAVGTMPSLSALREWEPEGMLVHLFDREFAEELIKIGVPTVNTTSTLVDCGLPLIEADHDKVGQMAARFFLDRGYQRFGFFGSSWTHFSLAREKAFRKVLHSAGHKCFSCYEELLPRRIDRESWKFVQEKTEIWLRELTRGSDPIAVFASNDVPARYLSNHCRNLGIEIPKDLALLSVDNDRYECRLASPPLSSIELPSFEIGRRAASLLDRMLKGGAPRKTPLWLAPTRIVLRGSTEATAVADSDVLAFYSWLAGNYAKSVTSDQLCTQLGVGRRTLERKLQDLLGTTIGREIRHRRIDEAKRLLLESNDSITSIAHQSGYSSPERLALVFRQTLHMTPTEFRQQHGSPNSDAD